MLPLPRHESHICCCSCCCQDSRAKPQDVNIAKHSPGRLCASCVSAPQHGQQIPGHLTTACSSQGHEQVIDPKSKRRLTPRQGLPCRCCCAGAWARWQLVLGQGSHVCAVLQQRRDRCSAVQEAAPLPTRFHAARFSCGSTKPCWAGAVLYSNTGKQDAGAKPSS